MFKRSLRSILLFVALFAIAAPVVTNAQACGGGDAVITGRVFSVVGGVNRPISGAFVTLSWISGPWGQMPNDFARTNTFGYYSLDACIANDYSLEVTTRTGYQVILVYPTTDITTRDFYFSP